MRTQIEFKNIYRFDEFSEEMQETIIDRQRDINTHYEWWDYMFDDFKRIGSLIGIEIDKIYFSGFSSQGDGACFTGSYSYRKGALKDIKTETNDEVLCRIAKDLQDIQRKRFYSLSANVSHSGHYNHEYCTHIEVSDDRHVYCDDEAEEQIKEYLRDYMRWMYRSLEKEYDWLCSDEAVRETIEANEYEFDEHGEII